MSKEQNQKSIVSECCSAKEYKNSFMRKFKIKGICENCGRPFKVKEEVESMCQHNDINLNSKIQKVKDCSICSNSEESWEIECRNCKEFPNKNYDCPMYHCFCNDLSNAIKGERERIKNYLTDGFIHYGHTGECTKLCSQIKSGISNYISNLSCHHNNIESNTESV
jgi:hypothetical protein